MPYSKTSELPSSVKDNLPEKAQELYLAAWNGAYKEYKDEEKASKTAWAAVSKQYEKDSDGKWVAKSKRDEADLEETNDDADVPEVERNVEEVEKVNEEAGVPTPEDCPLEKSIVEYEVRETIKTPKMFRSLPLLPGDIDKVNRRVNITFSSETPVQREFRNGEIGNEVLDHDPKSVRLDRIRAGGALLMDHDGKDLVGRVESIQIGNDRKGHATVRFGKSVRAEEVWGDVIDEIRTNVSVGYQIHDMIPEDGDGMRTYRVNDWEPLEISLCAIPADYSVGAGRTEERPYSTRVLQVIQTKPTIEVVESVVRTDQESGKIKMDEKEKVLTDERDRVSAINTIAEKHNLRELGLEFIKTGKTVDEFRVMVLDKIEIGKPEKSPMVGLSNREAEQFSFVRAINACVNGNWNLAPFEKEVSDAHIKRFGKNPHTELGMGFYVPMDVRFNYSRDYIKRAASDYVKGTATAGGDLIAEILQPQLWVEYLYNQMFLKALGMQTISGLVSDIDIPKQTGKSTCYWITEDGSPTDSAMTFGLIKCTPKTVGAVSLISRKMLIQSSVDIEARVRADIAQSLALELDRVGLNGHAGGATAEPYGIINWTSVGSVTCSNVYPTFAKLIEFETDVAVANALLGNCAYITTPEMRGVLKQLPKIGSTYPVFLWENNELNGYPAYATNQMPKTGGDGDDHSIIFGNFNDCILLQWAGVFVLIDPYSYGSQGSIKIVLLQDVDFAVRHAGSFAVATDAGLTVS